MVEWRSLARRWIALPLLAASFAYFASGLDRREASLLEAQDFGIACDLFRNFAISLDHSPLHFVLLNQWQRLDASSFAFIRLPSAAFCAMAVVVVFEIAAAEAGVLAGLASAWLFATNPLVVDNARSMRMYALVLLLSALCLRHAQRCLAARSADDSALAAWLLCAVLAVYTHLFGWLLVGPLALLIALGLRGREDWCAVLRSARVPVGVAAALLLIQLVHALLALEFVQGRPARYPGLPGRLDEFVAAVTRALFTGEDPPRAAWLTSLGCAQWAFVVFGAAILRRRGWIAVGALLLPGLLTGWILSRSSEVEARYFNYLLPLLATLQGVGLGQAAVAYVRLPVLCGALASSVYVTYLSYQSPASDWPDVASALPSRPGGVQVVAVFPAYFAATLERYVHVDRVVPIAVPSDLERVLARGKPLSLVRYTPVDFENMRAAIARGAQGELVLSTHAQTPLEVYRITPRRASAREREREPTPDDRSHTLVITGTIGSGGYAWQGRPGGAGAFRRLNPLFDNAGFVLASFAAYDPPWLLVPLYGFGKLRELRPNREVARALHRAGVTAVALSDSSSASDQAERILLGEQVSVIPAPPPEAAVAWRTYARGDLHVAVLNLASHRTLSLAQLALAIGRARAALGPTGRLVTMLPVSAGDDTAPSPSDRALARRLIDLGVDLVVGVGGLAAREIETYRHGVIAYSLGTLVCPPILRFCTARAASLALRVGVTPGGLRVDALPATFDDTSMVALAPRTWAEQLVMPHANAVESSLTPEVAEAVTSYQPREGAAAALGAFDADGRSAMAPARQWLARWVLEPIGRWFPRGAGEPTYPCRGGFFGHDAFVMRRSVRSGGEYGDVLEMDPGPQRWIALRFRSVTLRNSLRVVFGLADDRARPRFRLLHPQAVRLRMGDSEVVHALAHEVTGWHSAELDTAKFMGQQRDLELRVESNRTHFPVALDLVLSSASNTSP